MSENSIVKLTIAFRDPELDSEEREVQAQQFFVELDQMDEIEAVHRVLDPNPPDGNKSLGGVIVGLLTAEISVDNTKRVMGFLGDRLIGKPIELEVEADGKKLSVKAYSREELELAIKEAKNFVAV